MSDAPMDPSMPDPDDRGRDLAWLSDEPSSSAPPTDPARWPTAAREMEGLPGFILDDDRELVPVGGAGADPPPVRDASGGLGRASGQRVRLAFTWGRATAVAGVVAGMLVTTAVVYGELNQPPTGSGTTEPPAAGAPAPATPGAIDTDAVARLNDAVRTAQRRDRRIAAVRRDKRRAASARREERRPAPSAPVQTAQPVAETASPPAAAPAPVATPVADPWANVPGAVREFEPGPWNLGGSAS